MILKYISILIRSTNRNVKWRIEHGNTYEHGNIYEHRKIHTRCLIYFCAFWFLRLSHFWMNYRALYQDDKESPKSNRDWEGGQEYLSMRVFYKVLCSSRMKTVTMATSGGRHLNQMTWSIVGQSQMLCVLVWYSEKYIASPLTNSCPKMSNLRLI